MRALVEPEPAVRDYRQALHLARRIDSRYAEIEALTGLALAYDEDLSRRSSTARPRWRWPNRAGTGCWPARR